MVGGFSCEVALARATLLLAAAALAAGMQVQFGSTSEKFIRRQRGNHSTVPALVVRK